ncbi:MAG TPA: SH3 domain-containing protein [Rhodanobacteraceae bacterium]|nr:SH3 domain-containing protein [Rhodanobacteraceae bacterium]
MKSWRCIPILAAAVPLALAMSTAVHAQSADGYLTDDTPLYAGPAPEYPRIEGLPYGTYVSVQGCTDGWEWCDVVSDQGDWGWVPGDYIDYVYEGQPVVVTEYGPRIGIPIVSFSIATYWDEHYRDRPFYRERDSWSHRDIPSRAPPRPHHAADRKPPPPPPGGWHHGGHAAAMTHHASGGATHHENAPAPHRYESAPPHHENAPNPPRAPVNEAQHPHGDHHANIPTPQPMHEPPHAGNMPQPPHHGHVPPPPHPSSSTDHGKPPQHPKKKDDHDNGNDGGH